MGNGKWGICDWGRWFYEEHECVGSRQCYYQHMCFIIVIRNIKKKTYDCLYS